MTAYAAATDAYLEALLGDLFELDDLHPLAGADLLTYHEVLTELAHREIARHEA